MTQEAIASACKGQIVVSAPRGTIHNAGYTSDMLSDVIANAPEDSVLVTIQNHINTIAVSTLAGIKLIVVCHARPIPEDMRKIAEQEGVGILSTPYSQFEASCAIGKLISSESSTS